MRGLANYAMSGRYRALLIVVASSGSLLFGWIGAAIVALVILRRGFQEGLWLLLWGVLPALLLTRLTGDSSFLALLLGTAVLAAALRVTVSLPLTALCAAAVALLTGIGMLAFAQELLGELARVFEEFFSQLAEQAQRDGASSFALRPPTVLQIAGMMGTAIGGLSFLCLTLARYWQAALYNPGGFGEEWRALRFPPTLVLALIVAAIALASAGVSYRSWAAALLLPLTIGGFALLHAQAKQRGAGGFWLGGFYVAWMLLDIAKLALVGLVAADALVDFRGRWQRRQPGSGASPPRDGAGQADEPEKTEKTEKTEQTEQNDERRRLDRDDDAPKDKDDE